MSDPLFPFPHLIQALDLFAIERKPDSSFAAIAAPPPWLTPTLGVGADTPFGLAQMFPFLDSFLRDAEIFWRNGTEGRLTSGVFTAGRGSEELLLRASALNLGTRCIIVLERLHGDADTRPVLQKAREHTLAYERLARDMKAVQASLATIARLANELLATELTSAQREIAERIVGSVRPHATADGPTHIRR
jgi:hypothetical protein